MKDREEDNFGGEHFFKCRKIRIVDLHKDPKSPLEEIDNSDSVASYNIANPEWEKIFEKVEGKKNIEKKDEKIVRGKAIFKEKKRKLKH